MCEMGTLTVGYTGAPMNCCVASYTLTRMQSSCSIRILGGRLPAAVVRGEILHNLLHNGWSAECVEVVVIDPELEVAQFIRVCRWLKMIRKERLAPLENAPFSTPWARKRCSVAQRFRQYLRATNCYKLSGECMEKKLTNSGPLRGMFGVRVIFPYRVSGTRVDFIWPTKGSIPAPCNSISAIGTFRIRSPIRN
jgi:hypothetical protein